MVFMIVLIGMLSPTYWLADLFKQEANKEKVIRFLNALYLLISLLSLIVMLIVDYFQFDIYNITESLWVGIWSIFLISRCSEIFYAFLRDAHDKVSDKKSSDRKVIWAKSLIEIKNTTFKHKFLANLASGDVVKNSHRLVLSFSRKKGTELFSGIGMELNGANRRTKVLT